MEYSLYLDWCELNLLIVLLIFLNRIDRKNSYFPEYQDGSFSQMSELLTHMSELLILMSDFLILMSKIFAKVRKFFYFCVK